MKRMTMILTALVGAALMLSAVATAKPDSEAKSAKKLAQQQCKAEKKADKRAFKATYGKRAMRTCKQGEKDEAKAEIRNASQECDAEETADPDAFAAKYGSGKKGRNAYGKCVSSKVKAENEKDVESFNNAAKECKAERAGDPEGFKETYGTNKNKRNALGKCVSSKQEADDDAGDEETPEDETPAS